ncbi:hypothetical protein E1B28_000246 [Marasmius oreades]|uniref:Ribosome assembly protein 3 n=1 Tax=Marasmius oreades TaxID=181124 RepID=A0A9P7V106_9AGAR|nr:uncharacterized protein E1B28_000246 [Marasmius oreades]KAG7098283.1 hypothetical protein E1B28_000246 [Marasmius oreades]
MAGAAGKPSVPRKRNRKRKRRADFSSSSSSSSSESDDSDSEPAGVATITRKVITTQQESENGVSDSSGPESSSEDSDPEEIPQAGLKASREGPSAPTDEHTRARSTSPPPPSTAIPSFLAPKHPDESAGATAQREQEMKEKFRKFWMSAVADGFRDDLEEIRKEPNLTTSKLSLLIESLASGADLFSSTDKNGVNEMEMLLG